MKLLHAILYLSGVLLMIAGNALTVFSDLGLTGSAGDLFNFLADFPLTGFAFVLIGAALTVSHRRTAKAPWVPALADLRGELFQKGLLALVGGLSVLALVMLYRAFELFGAVVVVPLIATGLWQFRVGWHKSSNRSPA